MSTIGLELEWADVDRWSEIPPHLGTWNLQDYSIVNSDGHANCPNGATWRWGGEINTVPTETPQQQAAIVDMLRVLLNPTINYKCNLHVHVMPDVDLLADVDSLRRVAKLLREAESFVFGTIDPLPPIQWQEDEEAYNGEVKRYNRNKKSHHGSISILRWDEMMSATTVQEFKDAHAPSTKSGGRAWHIAQRTGMNLRSLWKHGTIEFRHFFGTADPEEIESAARWCQTFLEMVVSYRNDTLSGREIAEGVYSANGPWRFPVPQPYDHALQLGFEATKWIK